MNISNIDVVIHLSCWLVDVRLYILFKFDSGETRIIHIKFEDTLWFENPIKDCGLVVESL
jgi:hypothetical protein